MHVLVYCRLLLKSGLHSTGQAQLICQNGNWSSPPPTCTKAPGNDSLAYLYKHAMPDISQSLFAVFLMKISFRIPLIWCQSPCSTATSTGLLVASLSPPMTTLIGGGIGEAQIARTLGRVVMLEDQVRACDWYDGVVGVDRLPYKKNRSRSAVTKPGRRRFLGKGE